MNNIAGKVIVFEGINGSGKSHAMKAIAWWLEGIQNETVVLTKEPTEEPYGAALRHAWKNGATLSKHAENELFLLDRAEHTESVKKLSTIGGVVLSDRFWYSYVYQVANGLPIKTLRRSNAHFLEPDLTLLFTLDPVIAHQRVIERESSTRPVSLYLLTHVHYLYLKEFSGKANVVLIDASGSKEQTITACKEAISERLLYS